MSIIRADSIKNRAGNGAPDFPNGITVTGVVTSTSISQNITGNLSVTGNLGVGGVLTYEDVTNIDSIGIITARAGINVTGGVITGNGSGLTNLAVGLTTESISPSGITTHLDLSKDCLLYTSPSPRDS